MSLVRTSAWDRITEYPKHHFAVVNQKLRCNACSEIISEKKSSIEKHIKSKKHERGLSEIAKSKSESQTITACLQRRDNREKACGSTLPAEMRLFRFEVVESFLSGGIAFIYLFICNVYTGNPIQQRWFKRRPVYILALYTRFTHYIQLTY